MSISNTSILYLENSLQSILESKVELKRVSVSCGLEIHQISRNQLSRELWARYECLRRYRQNPLWQLDGRPMSSDIGIGTGKAAVSLLEKIHSLAPPGPLQLSLAESNNDHRYGKPLFKELDVVTRDRKNVNKNWTKEHMAIIKAAAKNTKVNKIFVNPAIKVWLCKNEGPLDRKWLMKVRPEKGHREHFHVRLKCPADSPNCVNTPLWNKYKNIDGCDKQLMWWVTDRLKPKPKKKKPKKKVTIKKKYKCRHASCYLPEDLPQQCIRTIHLQ